MWKLFLFHCILSASSLHSELGDLLSSTDQFFREFHVAENSNFDPESVKLMLKRTYNLNERHKIHKRSLEEDEKLIQDPHGVYMLSNIQDVSKIPVKFPNDINILSFQNLLYITALEANRANPENQLANDLVLFHYSSIQGIREMGRVPVSGGIRTAMYLFQNTTYVVAAEFEASENPDFYQGSTVYKMVERSGRVFLEKIQILNVIQPNDLKFWEFQDQLYLAIGTNMGNNTQRTGTLIYRWLGRHFDRLQVIPSKNVKSVMPFSIGSFMYLAVANYEDENGNLDIRSEIYEFNLQEMKFKPFQSINTHGARDISYFNFEDAETKEKEHFLIVANSLGKDSDEKLTSLKESIIYKFSDNYFIPFQSFRLHGVTQWLPIKGPNNEFLLLGSHTNGVVGYQYDGWRFTSVSLKFGQSYFGSNIRGMRAFYYFGDLFLTIADKSSYGHNVNLWKLSFSNKNYLENHYKELETWCKEMNKNMNQDDFKQVVEKFKLEGETSEESDEEESEEELTAENYTMGNSNEEVRDELEHLNEETKNLENLLEDAEKHVDKYKTESELPIVLGSQEIASFELKCQTKDCCRFKKLKVLKMNGENVTDFLENAVPLNQKLASSVLEFEHLTVENDISSSMVNGHPFETLVDTSSDMFVNSEFIVNGTVFINKDLNVNSGLFDGVRPDKEHMLLLRGRQNMKEDLIVDNLKVKNLQILGLLNGESIENLLKKPEMDLPMDYKELNVNYMKVEGLVSGYNLSKVFDEALRKSGSQVLEGDINITSLEADEIVVDSDHISNVSIPKILEALEDRLCQTDPQSFLEINPLEGFQPKSDTNDPEKQNVADEYVIIVEGLLKAKDFSDESNSTSLLNIVNNSLKLNETVIDSNMQFSNIRAVDLETDFINEIPFSSWISRNSEDSQRILGKKTFLDNVHIQEEVVAERINNIDLEKLEGDVLRLNGDQIVRGDIKFNSIKCSEITTNFTNFGSKGFDRMNRMVIRNSIITDQLEVENLTLTGDLDSLSWEEILEDSVYEKDVVSGKKTIKGPVQVGNLNVTGRINDLPFEDFVALTSADANKIVLDRNVTLKEPLNVDELNFEGLLNQVLKPNFDREWLLRDETQIITGPFTFENVDMKLGANLMNETVNNVNLRKLFTKSIKINEKAKIKHLFSMGKVRAQQIDIGGTLNGADFRKSIILSNSRTPQVLSGDWFFTRGLTVNGSLVVDGYLSGLNLTHLCSLNSNKLNLIIGGSLTLKQEPVVVSKVNDLNLGEKIKEIWMKNENTTLKGQDLRFGDVDFDNKTTLLGFLNNVNLTDTQKFYLSKTQNKVISADYVFENLTIKKSCRMHEATVGGTVNGINLNHWAENVLLQDKEQVIREKLRFEKFETSNLNAERTVNGLNLTKDVLRYDVEDAVVEGEKTFPSISVLNLTLASGRTLQGVDIVALKENSVRTTRDAVIKGDLDIYNATFNGPFNVSGKVNGIYFDSKNLLTTNGNQIVKGVKHFDYTDGDQNPGMKIRFFEVSGLINGIDLDSLIKNQAYSDRNLIFKQPKTFTKGLRTDSMEVDGLFHGVNVSVMCHDVFNPVEENTLRNGFSNLLNETRALIKIAKDRVDLGKGYTIDFMAKNRLKGVEIRDENLYEVLSSSNRAFFFNYLELIQTLKPQIKAAVPTLDNDGSYLLAVFTSNTMKLMEWNAFSESFVNRDEVLSLSNNVTFVASEIFENGSFLYIQTAESAKIFEPKLLKEIEAINTSCIAAFRLKPLEKECIFIGEKWNSSRILCKSFLMNDLQTYQHLESKGSVQVSVLTTEDETFIAVINKEITFDRVENTLSIYRFDPKLQHFYVSHTLAEINPVAVSTVTYKGDHYMVSAGGHLPESVHNSMLSIFRFNKRHKVFVREQSIQVDTPVDVHFAILPSNQLALYVLSANPTKPFVMFLHKGIMGFVKETSGLALYPGSQLHSFTDSENRHFVIISGFGRGQILRAGFKGEKVH